MIEPVSHSKCCLLKFNEGIRYTNFFRSKDKFRFKPGNIAQNFRAFQPSDDQSTSIIPTVLNKRVPIKGFSGNEMLMEEIVAGKNPGYCPA